MMSPDNTTPINPPKGRYSLAIITDPDNRVLCLKRAPGDRFAGGQWGLPGGGIEVGESSWQALCRELKEELGDRFRSRYLAHFMPVRDSFYGGIYELHLFRMEVEETAILLSEEHTEFSWVSGEAFKELETFAGIDEDLAHVGVWPVHFLKSKFLPKGFVPAQRLPSLFPVEHRDGS
jgi:8-oxo-dGTP pyrophosphatase MutT (NUDIX family)